MKSILSLAGWNWRLARRSYGILCGAFALEQLAVLLWQASRPALLGAGLAVYYAEGFQPQAFALALVLAGLLAAPAANDRQRAKCSYTWLTLPLPPGARLAAHVLTAVVLELGMMAWQLALYLVYYFPVQALESALAMNRMGTAMPAQNLYEQLLNSEVAHYLLPKRPRQLALMVAILLLSALLLTCVRLHRGWRRGAAVVLGVVSGFCCLALFEGEFRTALYGTLTLSSTLLLLAAVPLAAAAFSIWWALRAIRRAEPA